MQAPIEPPALGPTVPPTPGISFRNSQAVVITLLVAAGAMVGAPLVVLFAPPLVPVFLCAIGFLAVRIYVARASETVTARAGARLGWMTGLWLFLIMAVLLTVCCIYVASPEGWAQMRATWSQLPQTASLVHMSQHEFLMQVLSMLPFSFLMFTILPVLGGLLGAKFPQGRKQA